MVVMCEVDMEGVAQRRHRSFEKTSVQEQSE